MAANYNQHMAAKKGRIRSATGEYLHYSGRIWTDSVNFAWFGTREQARNLIQARGLTDADFDLDNEFVAKRDKMNPKPNRPGVYNKD